MNKMVTVGCLLHFLPFPLSSYLFNYSVQSRESPGLVPVTVKQISEASHSGEEKANFVINDVDITNVYFLVFSPTAMYYFKTTTGKRC